MRITMIDRRVLAKTMCERYRKAPKKRKGVILDEFVQSGKCSRDHARRLLRNHGRRVEVRPGVVLEGDARIRRRVKRKREYGPEVLGPLRKMWTILDYVCGKRLKAALPALMARLEACKELRLNKTVRNKLLRISPATIDRLLAPERAKYALKRRGGTKPGTLLKRQIPIRTFSDWDDARPGFLEMDLVSHDGGVAQGDYCLTLDLTDVATGWSEQVAVRNKAQIHVFEAIQEARRRLPFEVLGLDSDNGSEFINHQMQRLCAADHITFTRSRPYRKNDNCFVEQKNWSVVRRLVGYARYDTEKALITLNELYSTLHDYNNFFIPSLKLKEKVRDGARVTRRYHPAQTPYERLLESPHISPAVKKRIKARYEELNPAELHRKIQRLQNKLLKLATRTQQPPEAA